MSDFTMGATLTLTDNFSSTLQAAGQTAQNFKSQMSGMTASMTSVTSAASQSATATDSLTDSLKATEEMAGSMGASFKDSVAGVDSMKESVEGIGEAAKSSQNPMEQSTQSTNRWKAAIQQFNAGTQDLKTLPGMLKMIASQKLTGLTDSMVTTRLQASLLVAGLKTVAKQKFTSLTASFKEFKSTVQEGRTGCLLYTSPSPRD